MAVREIRLCDPCAEEQEETVAVKTVIFPVGRKEHEIDLCEQHHRDYTELTRQLESYQALGHPVVRGAKALPPAEELPHAGGTGVEAPAATQRPRGDRTGEAARQAKNQKIREWARLQGIEMPERGRIPDDLLARYDEAHPEPAAASA